MAQIIFPREQIKNKKSVEILVVINFKSVICNYSPGYIYDTLRFDLQFNRFTYVVQNAAGKFSELCVYLAYLFFFFFNASMW